MAITFDPAKSERNRELRGFAFGIAADLDWSTALIGRSFRQELTATRFVAVGEIEGLLYVLVFVLESAIAGSSLSVGPR